MPSPPLPISIPPLFIWVTLMLDHAANTALWSHVFRSEWRSIQHSTPFYLYGALWALQTLSLVALISSPTSFTPCLDKCHFLVTQFQRRSIWHPTPFIQCFVSSANLELGCHHLISDLFHSMPRWMPYLSNSGVNGMMHWLDFHKFFLGTMTCCLQPLPPSPLSHLRTSFTA